jgi:Zn-dependent peptidase ImmA (M78 family)
VNGRPTGAFVKASISAPAEANNNSGYPGRLIDKLGIRELLNERVPVNIESIAKALRAESVQKTDISVAGMLLPTEDSFRILVNKNEYWVRQRFTCAHEIAHAILEPKLNPSMRQELREDSNDLERHCDELAAQLLMPDPIFSRYAKSEACSVQTVIKLARTFQTSVKATTIRTLDVIDEPCIAIFSSMVAGRTGTKLRVQWNHQNLRRVRRRHSYFLPKGKSVNLATAEMAYRTNQSQAKNEFIDIGNLRFKGYTESSAFGSGKSRYVLSLVLPERQ